MSMMKLNPSSDTNFDSNHLISTEYYPKIRIFTRSEESTIHNYIKIISIFLSLKTLNIFFYSSCESERLTELLGGYL